MPVFISYSHEDRDFAHKLAGSLVSSNVHVWIDTWELGVGDSIVERIQSAIGKSDCLCVVLSKSAVQSAWCKKEINAGLLRELQERRVVVLPLLIEDCELPVFLRDKLYADFRTDFQSGLRVLLPAIASATSLSLMRVEHDEYYVDFAFDYGILDDRMLLTVNSVFFYNSQPFSVISRVRILGNEETTERYREFRGQGLEWFYAYTTIYALAHAEKIQSCQVHLIGDRPDEQTIVVKDKQSRKALQTRIWCRRLGQDTGKDVVFRYGTIFEALSETLMARQRKLTLEEERGLGQLIFGF